MQRHAALRHLLAQRGQKRSAMSDAPTRFPTVLQVLGRWVLALTIIFSAGRCLRCYRQKYGTRQSRRYHRNGGLLAALVMQACAAARDQHMKCTYPYAAFH